LDAVVDAALAEVGALDAIADIGEKALRRALHFLPLRAARGFVGVRADLDPIFVAGVPGLFGVLHRPRLGTRLTARGRTFGELARTLGRRGDVGLG
jgi:hypothetical protein